MPLSAGQRLGPYEILAPLGSGGVGEVYNARDTRLDRVVAVKVLREHLVNDPDRRARFDREARAISKLSHPNICALYDAGHDNGVDYIVIEYLNGQTLAERLNKGALPLEHALAVAIDIAAALDAAHRAGIVHRDIKPANVMLTKAGAKLLDFGIACFAPSATVTASLTQGTITVDGELIGTPQYMAPEQLEGRNVDARTDLFAFGALLYEMLTGRRAFPGDTNARAIAAVLDADPVDASSLTPDIPASLSRLVAACLAKDPADRWQNAADLERNLQWIAAEHHSPSSTAARPRPLSLVWPLVAAAFLAAVLAMVVVVWFQKVTQDAGDVTRTFVDVAPADTLATTRIGRPERTQLAVSSDGRLLVFGGRVDGREQLYLRRLNRLQAEAIAGTERAVGPFFSPDGQWIGFYAAGELRRVSVAGGPAISIARVDGGPPYGASWGADDRIVFAKVEGGLWIVPAGGGTPERLTTLDTNGGEVSHRLPHVLPHSDAVLFTVTRNRFPRWDATDIFLYSSRTHSWKLVLSGGADARYAAGRLVYVRHGVLMTLPFNEESGGAAGVPVPLVDNVMQEAYSTGSGTDSGAAQFALSDTGLLVYVPGGIVPEPKRRLVWVDRTGRVEPLPLAPRGFAQVRLSPDGRRLAFGLQGPAMDIWVTDVDKPNVARLTTQGRNGTPVWTPDGGRIVYRSSIAGMDAVMWQAADGSDAPANLTHSLRNQAPAFWSSNGNELFFYEVGDTTDLWAISATGNRQVRRVLMSTLAGADLSPDGRWLASASAETGNSEVYISKIGGSGKRRVSIDGGITPLWRRDGHELFYVRLEGSRIHMMAMPITTSPGFSTGAATELFAGPYRAVWPGRAFDAAPDGRRFLMTEEPDEPPLEIRQMVVAQNWWTDVDKGAPGKRH